MDCREPQARDLLFYQLIDIGIVELGDGSAFSADQKLPRVGASGVGATDVGVYGIQAMDQIGFNQEIERPIDRRRRRFFTFKIEAVQNIVRACRLVTVPYELENTTAYLRESQSLFAAQFPCSLECRRDTGVVVVLRRRKTFR